MVETGQELETVPIPPAIYTLFEFGYQDKSCIVVTVEGVLGLMGPWWAALLLQEVDSQYDGRRNAYVWREEAKSGAGGLLPSLRGGMHCGFCCDLAAVCFGRCTLCTAHITSCVLFSRVGVRIRALFPTKHR